MAVSALRADSLTTIDSMDGGDQGARCPSHVPKHTLPHSLRLDPRAHSQLPALNGPRRHALSRSTALRHWRRWIFLMGPTIGAIYAFEYSVPRSVGIVLAFWGFGGVYLAWLQAAMRARLWERFKAKRTEQARQTGTAPNPAPRPWPSP